MGLQESQHGFCGIFFYILFSFSPALCQLSSPQTLPPPPIPSLSMATLIQPSSHVGFDSITSQIEHRLLKRGFQFNIMVVGQSGLGKTTFVNTLFASHLAETCGRIDPSEEFSKTPDIKVVSHVIEENGVRLKLNIIDTPGYGDQINNEKCWDPIAKYIKDQHSAYLRKELTALRDRYLPDTRVHCVIYFIQPTGHGLKPIDIVVLKKLTETANVIPVIAKSDSLTLVEREAFKRRLQDEFAYHKLRLYPNDSYEDYDENDRALNKQINQLLPFAIVGSEQMVTVDGKEVRGRKHRWGVINVEDENHCEFSHLRNFLISARLQDLIETTAHIHYESFRSKQLMALKGSSASTSSHQQQQQTPAQPQTPAPTQPPAQPTSAAPTVSRSASQTPFANAAN